MAMTLDQATVAGLKLTDGRTDQVFFDDEPTLRRFGIRVRVERKSGKVVRQWIVQYRSRNDRRQHRYKLGDFARMSADVARKKAVSMLAKIDEGNDPAETKERERIEAAMTFSVAVEQYLTMKALEVRLSSLRQSRLYLTNKRYFGSMHKMPLSKITRSDVSTSVNKIIVASGAPAAGRARAHLSAAFTWAMRNGHTDANPCINSVNPKPGPSRDRVLNNSELVKVWNACGDDDFGRIVRLIALTACRRAEIGQLKWSEIDLEAGIMMLPAERTKNHRAHVLPLVPAALEILRSIPRRLDRDYIFGDYGVGFTTWWIEKQHLQDGIEVPWSLHDLRRSVATGLGDLDIAPHVIEALLNHQSGTKAGVAGTYNRSKFSKQIKIALDRWADHIDEIVSGRDDGDKVVVFRPAS
jgi:integrase